MEARRHHRRRRLQDEIAKQRLPHRQRLDIGQPGAAQIGDGERIGGVASSSRRNSVAVDDRLEPGCRFALIGLALAADVRGRSDRIEQPAAGRGHRRVDAVAEHGVEHRPRPARKIGIDVELGEIHGKFRPAHLGHQMGVEVAPRLARGLRAAQHCHRLEGAEPLDNRDSRRAKTRRPRVSRRRPSRGRRGRCRAPAGASSGMPFSARHAATWA